MLAGSSGHVLLLEMQTSDKRHLSIRASDCLAITDRLCSHKVAKRPSYVSIDTSGLSQEIWWPGAESNCRHANFQYGYERLEALFISGLPGRTLYKFRNFAD